MQLPGYWVSGGARVTVSAGRIKVVMVILVHLDRSGQIRLVIQKRSEPVVRFRNHFEMAADRGFELAARGVLAAILRAPFDDRGQPPRIAWDNLQIAQLPVPRTAGQQHRTDQPTNG